MTTEIEIGDTIEIPGFVDSEVIDIFGNIYQLRDGNQIMNNNGEWKLLVNIGLNKLRVRKGNENTPILPLVELLKVAEEPEFRKLCSTNYMLNKICSNKLTNEEKSKYGNLTEEMYEERCKNFIEKDFIEYRNPNLTWKQFYDQYIMFLKDYPDFQTEYNRNIVYGYYDQREIEEFIIKSLDDYNIFLFISIIQTFRRYINRFGYSDIFYHAMNHENINFLKFLTKNNILPDQNDLNFAKYHGKTKVLEYYASLNPPILPTN